MIKHARRIRRHIATAVSVAFVSLAMAPAMIIAQGAQTVDLDGPLLLAKDRENGLRYEGSPIVAAEDGADAGAAPPGCNAASCKPAHSSLCAPFSMETRTTSSY